MMQQAIICTNDVLVYWCIYASFSYELNAMNLFIWFFKLSSRTVNSCQAWVVQTVKQYLGQQGNFRNNDTQSWF